MSNIDELSLGETSTTTDEASVDEAVKSFDLQSFIAGVRPGKVTVALYSRPDLEAHIGRVRSDGLDALNAGNKLGFEEASKRLVELQTKYAASRMDVTLEERSEDWQARKIEELKKEGIIDKKRLTLFLLAAQIVEPLGLTGEDLEQLAEVIPTQVKRLVAAWGELQNQPIEGLPGF